MTKSQLARLNECLWPKGERRDIWMIVDGARSRRVFETLLASSFLSSCLYAGFVPPALEASAPHLLQLEFDDPQSLRILDRAWGQSWGVLLRCEARLETLRKHLRSLLTIREQKGGQFLFRYYDPRVLRVYLPSCTGEELRTFFGPIDQFWTEGDSPDRALQFSLNESTLVQSAITLNMAGTLPARPVGESRTSLRRVPGMLVVRREQMSMFSTAAEKQFEDWMAAHLHKFFSLRCKRLGEDRVRELICYGIRRAASYGLTLRRDVCKYIDVMLVFGRDFDDDPRQGWATSALSRACQDGKGQALIGAAQQHLRNLSSR